MDPLKSLVKKKRLFTSFLKYDLLNQAAAEANLYSEEQGRELMEIAQDNPVDAIEKLLELIRVQSTYEAFIWTLERSIEIGHSQQRTVVDAQAHEQLIREIVGEKKPKESKGTKVNPWPFKTKEKKSKESESKQYFSNKDKVKIGPQTEKYAPRQNIDFQETRESTDLWDVRDLQQDSVDENWDTEKPRRAAFLFNPKQICAFIGIQRAPKQLHSHYGGRTTQRDTHSLCDSNEYSRRTHDVIHEQGPSDQESLIDNPDHQSSMLPRSNSFRRNQGEHSDVFSKNQPMSFDQNVKNVNENSVNVNVDTGTGLQRAPSTTSLDYGFGKADSNIANLQREFQEQKKLISTLAEKVNQLEVVASRVEKQFEKDQDMNRTDHKSLRDSIGNMGDKLTALESSGTKEGVRFQEELRGLQAKYQEMEKEKDKMKEKEEKLLEKIQELQIKQASLDANEKKQVELLRVEVARLQVQPRSSHSEPQTQVVEQAKLEACIQKQIKVYIQHIQSDVKVLHDKIKASETDKQKFQKDIEELQHTNSLLHSDVTAAENKLAQYDSRLKGTKEEMDKVSRQSATMQAKMSSREEFEGVSRELRLLIDKHKREINDLKERLGQSQEQIEQMGTRQKTVEGEIQNQNQSIKSIHQKLPGNKDDPTEWDKLHKELVETGREMLKINKVTEKIESMEEDMNKLRSQVEKQYDDVQTLSQTHKSGKPAEGNQAATGHMYIASLEGRVMDMQESWEKKFEEFTREVRIDSEWILEIYQLFAKMNEVRGEIEASVLKRKRALQEKSNP